MRILESNPPAPTDSLLSVDAAVASATSSRGEAGAWRQSIRFRFILLVVLIISLGSGLFGAWNHSASRTERFTEFDRHLDEIGLRLSTTLAPAIWEFNHQQVAQI